MKNYKHSNLIVLAFFLFILSAVMLLRKRVVNSGGHQSSTTVQREAEPPVISKQVPESHQQIGERIGQLSKDQLEDLYEVCKLMYQRHFDKSEFVTMLSGEHFPDPIDSLGFPSCQISPWLIIFQAGGGDSSVRLTFSFPSDNDNYSWGGIILKLSGETKEKSILTVQGIEPSHLSEEVPATPQQIEKRIGQLSKDQLGDLYAACRLMHQSQFDESESEGVTVISKEHFPTPIDSLGFRSCTIVQFIVIFHAGDSTAEKPMKLLFFFPPDADKYNWSGIALQPFGATKMRSILTVQEGPEPF